MKKAIFLFLFSAFVCMNLNAQQFLLLSKTDKLKNYKYFTGDRIHIKFQDSLEMTGVITGFRDSLIVLNSSIPINPKHIQSVLKERRIMMMLSKAGFIAGLGYFSLTGFNRLINNDAPIYTESSLWISGAMIAGSFLLRPFLYKKIRISEDGWKLQVLGFPD